MTVLSVRTDTDALTLTLSAELTATPTQVWQLWADPRLLERWWGPPTYPATFAEHDLRAGGSATYAMTGPQGDRHHGWWRFLAVEPPHSIEFDDGFADESGRALEEMPTIRMRVTLAEGSGAGRTRMTLVSRFASAEALEQVLAMGMEEGIALAAGQLDALLEVGAR